MNRLISASLLLMVLMLAGCAPGSDATWKVLQRIRGPSATSDSVSLSPDPKFRYLRVVVSGRVTVLVLGEIDPHPHGDIEVWYSSSREAVRLQNGRLIGISGLVTEWRDVRFPVLPSWGELARAGKSLTWVRQRDVMPGYRFNVRETLVLRPIAVPGDSLLTGVDPATYRWFEEATVPTRPDDEVLPAARYAVRIDSGREVVEYAEQCISRTLCFTWQTWPPVKPAAAK